MSAQSRKPDGDELSLYTVTLADVPHTMQLDDAMADVYGELATEVRTPEVKPVPEPEPEPDPEPEAKRKATTSPANKARTPGNK